MTARIAVGSVSMLAMCAALMMGASVWLNRPGASTHATPWGDLSSLSNGRTMPSPAGDGAELLKLAALKSGNGPSAPAAAQTAPVAAPASSPAAAAAVTTSDAPAAGLAAASEQAAPAAVAPAAAPVEMAAAEVPPVAAAADDPPAAKPAGIDLNTASADALDRIGAGRVGRTIVAHRPYRSVKDLVNKRVLRFSDYQKVEGRVRVD